MDRLPFERSKQEIEQGIASVTAALGNATALAPFLRIPGLRRTDEIEAYAASKGLQLWSADFPADDWRDVSANRVYELAMQRLEKKGKGILLLHDIQPRTVAALPRILHEMKARGYRIVHVVPATPERPATPTEPQQWQLRPASDVVATSRWPKVPKFAFVGGPVLPIPAFSNLDWHTTNLGVPRRGRSVPLPRTAPWPRQATLPPAGTLAVLPVPATGIFRIPESARVTLLASSARRPAPLAQARSTEVSSAKLDGISHRHGRAAAAESATTTGQAQPPQGTAAKPAKQAKRNTRVAGLKKR
jgi:hypothetical protein